VGFFVDTATSRYNTNMVLTNSELSIAEAQHIVLDDVSWEFYEHLLREVGNRPIRITYDQGSLEIMSPLPMHEHWGSWIARLIELMCFERDIVVRSYGSTTFRSRPKKKGFEPDKCFYIKNADAVRNIEGPFNPAKHPPPDLAIEIDITSRSIEREPIYAALGVRELWRFDGERLAVLHLMREKYVVRSRSRAFPFLPMGQFEAFVLRLPDKNQLLVLREFRDWVRSLAD
jgi:Uma2 family endonuclease